MVLAAWLVFAWVSPARAQEILLTGPLVGAPAASNRASLVGERHVLPSGRVEVGTDLVLVTSERELGGQDIELTDLAFLHVRARRAFASWLELYVATTVLPKQPNGLDELVWQGASLSLRVQLPLAIAVGSSVDGGPLLENDGYFWRSSPHVVFRPRLDNDFAFELGAGATSTVLEFAGAGARRLYLYEVSVSAMLQVGKSGDGGGWLGFEYHVPVASNRDDAPFSSGMPDFDPTNRLSLRVGGVSPSPRGWDLWVEYAVIDRGSVEDPATMLPILDGGFDQRQISFGVQHRFGGRRR